MVGSSSVLHGNLFAEVVLLDEAKTAADNNRLIPPFSSDATDPAEIYSLHDIIPEVEWKGLSVSAIEQAGNDRERIAMLPMKWSDWTNYHLNGTRDETKKERKKNLYAITS